MVASTDLLLLRCAILSADLDVPQSLRNLGCYTLSDAVQSLVDKLKIPSGTEICRNILQVALTSQVGYAMGDLLLVLRLRCLDLDTIGALQSLAESTLVNQETLRIPGSRMYTILQRCILRNEEKVRRVDEESLKMSIN